MKNNLKSINDTKIIPKVLPFRCPVCRGFGTVNYGKLTCKACKGNGMVLIDQEKKEGVYKVSDFSE